MTQKGSPKWNWGSHARALVWAVATIGIFARPVVAEEVEPPPPPRDCRYLHAEDPATAQTADEHRGERFPKDDVFRPLTADPKEPRFLVSYQRVRFREANDSINAGFIGFGENFGLWGKRQEKGCDGWQIGVLGAVFSQFNLDGPSTDLINSDFLMGFPLTWRYGILSGRVRAYHQSSHLGDEFILHRPGFQRINLSFEEIDSLVSLDLWWARLYGGGGFIVHREPELKRGKAQWGIELRSSKGVGFIIGSPIVIAAADFKSFEQQGWNVNSNVVGGLEWYAPRATRRMRLFVNWYYGYNPYGQFFTQKVQTVGIGFYFGF